MKKLPPPSRARLRRSSASRRSLAGCKTAGARSAEVRTASRTTTACATRSRCARRRRPLTVFIGDRRGGLTPAQRAEVGALRLELAARGDRRHRDRDAGRHARTSAPPRSASREIRAILGAAGVPPHAIEIRPYRTAGSGPARHHPRQLSARWRPRPARAACGPKDLGPTYDAGLLVEPAALESSAAPPSAISPRRSPTRPTSCSRAPKTPVLASRRATVHRQVPQGRSRPRRNIRMPIKARSATWANDQIRTQRRRAERRTRRTGRAGRAHRAGAAHLDPGVLRPRPIPRPRCRPPAKTAA